MKIQVLALDGVFDTGLSALLDTFAVANDLAGIEGGKAPAFEVTLLGVRKRVRTAQGLLVPVQAASGSARPDVVVLPAIGAKSPAPLREALDRRDVRDACDLMNRQHQRGARVGAACTGTFVLAASGLLEGQAATTSWWLAPLFRELYPRVLLDESRMVVDSALCVTAGAALAHLDLALWLVRQASPALATLAAHYLLVDARPSQAVFMIPDHLAHSDPLVQRFEAWARNAMARGFSLADAARVSGTSERTLGRRVRTVLGKSPLSYFQDLRVERAVHLLRTTTATVDDIATQVGYADGVTLRTLLRHKLGKGVRELRVAI